MIGDRKIAKYGRVPVHEDCAAPVPGEHVSDRDSYLTQKLRDFRKIGLWAVATIGAIAGYAALSTNISEKTYKELLSKANQIEQNYQEFLELSVWDKSTARSLVKNSAEIELGLLERISSLEKTMVDDSIPFGNLSEQQIKSLRDQLSSNWVLPNGQMDPRYNTEESENKLVYRSSY